jgi:hypothetical protein
MTFKKAAFGLLFAFLKLSVAEECVDNDQMVAQLAAINGLEDISACIDVLGGCSLQDNRGTLIRQHCCVTCADNFPGNPARESELPPTDETVQIFLLSGQSDCTGQASNVRLNADSTSYPDLQGAIPGVWFASYSSPADIGRFFIAPMQAGSDGRSSFGPEISFGERIHAVTKKPTMIMKYCVGGTQVYEHWNPSTATNQWDKENDDGTAQWMADNAGLDFQSKYHLFKNMAYTIRLTNETLTAANIPFEWAGIGWVQGIGDLNRGDDPTWKTFGENTARVWEGFRAEIGSDVPIVDTGAGPHNQLKTGKEYATQIVKGCKAKNLQYASAANDDTSNDCQVSASNPCPDAPNMHQNYAFFDDYGWDPLVPEEMKPNGYSSKTFRWWAKFPTNLHSGYEGMILNGRYLANGFIREFTSYDLGALEDDDPITRYPFEPCATGTRATDENLCWIDYREESLMIEKCTEEESSGSPSSSTKQQKQIWSSFALFTALLFGLP